MYSPSRLGRLLERGPGRLVHLWTWPGGEARELVASVARISGIRIAPTMAAGALIAEAEPGPDRDIRALVLPLEGGTPVSGSAGDGEGEGARGGTAGDLADRIAALLDAYPRTVRVVVVGSPRPLFWPGTVLTSGPEELCYRPEELEAAIRAGGGSEPEDRARDIHRITGGWPSPCRRCLELLDGAADPGPEELEQQARAAAWSAIRHRLADLEVELLTSICSAPRTGLEVWRQALTGDPLQLAALEGLWRRWGLVRWERADPGASVPRLLQAPPPGTVGEVKSDPETGVTILRRQLERAAHGLLESLGEPRGAELEPRSSPMPAGVAGPLRSPELGGPGVAAGARSGEKRGAAHSWTLHLLGAPRVIRRGSEGEAEIEWRLRRSFLLVAFLALAPDRRATRAELAEAAWPEARPDAIRRNFHPTLSEARRALIGSAGRRRGGILYRQGYYCLDPSLEWHSDRDLFLAHLARAKGAQAGLEVGDQGGARARGRALPGAESALGYLQAAWKLYKGPLLEGFDAEWIEPERERLYRRYLEMLSTLGRL
ncbi:MAG: hypothetical protein MI919_22290, partial [Holophagales bacterium]|nr:hypothetical protein [Holophagales bacterium]